MLQTDPPPVLEVRQNVYIFVEYCQRDRPMLMHLMHKLFGDQSWKPVD